MSDLTKYVGVTEIKEGSYKGLYGPGFVVGLTKPGYCGHNRKIGACPQCWPEEPVRSAGDAHDDYTETHPAYGQIGASRVSGRGRLFMSDFDHQHFMVLRIHESSLHRGLSNDRIHEGKRLIEIAMSEAQWATFISSPNSSSVPCTLEYVNGKTISRLPEPKEQKSDRFVHEMVERLKGALEGVDKLRERIKAGKGGNESLKLADGIEMQIKNNLEFVADQFGEYIENTVEKAKVEISTYLDVQTRARGLQSPIAPAALPEETKS